MTTKNRTYMNENIENIESMTPNACVCVGDVYKHKYGAFTIRYTNGDNICYIDAVQLDSEGNVGVLESIMFYIDDFDTFEDLERVNSDTFKEIMEQAKVEISSRSRLNYLFENLKGVKI